MNEVPEICKPLIGKKLNCGEVIGYYGHRSNKVHIFTIKCNCGKEYTCSKFNVDNNKTKGCHSCCLKGRLIKKCKNDLTGKRFGRLVAIERLEEKSRSFRKNPR